MELLPCPFCGGTAELREWDWPYARFQVRCSACKTAAKTRLSTKSKAIAAWNTRAPTAALQEAVAGLEAARSVLAHSGAESGVCMCGDPCEGHNFGSGHSPVDSHQYVSGQVVEQIDAAITRLRATVAAGDLIGGE